MRTALDLPATALDAHERDFCAKIREHGWHGTHVLADEEGPGFSYTTGLWLHLGFPEIVVFSLGRENAHDVLWDVYRDVKDGRRYSSGVRIADLFANVPAFLFPVAMRHYADHLGWSRWFYNGDEFPCLQLVWPDRQGRFPWEQGSGWQPKAQPDLTAEGWATALRQ